MSRKDDLLRLRALFVQQAHHELYHVVLTTAMPVTLGARVKVLFPAQIGHMTVIKGQAYEGDRAIEIGRTSSSSQPRTGEMSVKKALIRAATTHLEPVHAWALPPCSAFAVGLSAFAGDAEPLAAFDSLAAMALPLLSDPKRSDWPPVESPQHHDAHEVANLLHRLIQLGNNSAFHHIAAHLVIGDWHTGGEIADFSVSVYTETGGAGNVCKGGPDDPVRKMLEAAAGAQHEVLIFPCNIFRAAAMTLQMLAEDADRPSVGFLRMEDIRERHADLSEAELENVRNRLQDWRKKNEDACFAGSEDPETGRRRWAYPVSKVDEIADGQREKRGPL